MITADVGCRLAELDFGGIEARLTGWLLLRHGFSSTGAQQYCRLARLGMHAAVTSIKVGKPVDLTQSDAHVKRTLDAVKEAHPTEYDTAKRTVHANNYGMTVYGMVERFPQFFPTIKAAEEFQSFYYALAPDLPLWHTALRKRAREAGMLGGPTLPGAAPGLWDHPYGYRHWFWDVFTYRPANEFTARKWLRDPSRAARVVNMHGKWFTISPGGDWNRTISEYPQSIASGHMKDSQLALFSPDSPDFIGDCYFGRTPLLAPIHDSLLLHIPNRCWDRVVEIVARVMQRPNPRLPIPASWNEGSSLAIGVSGSAGRNWAPYINEQKQLDIEQKTGQSVPLNLSGMSKLALPGWDEGADAAGLEWSAAMLDEGRLWAPEGTGEEEEWIALQRVVA